jgi:hypothetical protein
VRPFALFDDGPAPDASRAGVRDRTHRDAILQLLLRVAARTDPDVLLRTLGRGDERAWFFARLWNQVRARRGLRTTIDPRLDELRCHQGWLGERVVFLLEFEPNLAVVAVEPAATAPSARVQGVLDTAGKGDVFAFAQRVAAQLDPPVGIDLTAIAAMHFEAPEIASFCERMQAIHLGEPRAGGALALRRLAPDQWRCTAGAGTLHQASATLQPFEPTRYSLGLFEAGVARLVGLLVDAIKSGESAPDELLAQAFGDLSSYNS